MNTGYNIRLPQNTTAAAEKSSSAIASGDQFTAYAVDETKASINEEEPQPNRNDDQLRDLEEHYIHLNGGNAI